MASPWRLTHAEF